LVVVADYSIPKYLVSMVHISLSLCFCFALQSILMNIVELFVEWECKLHLVCWKHLLEPVGPGMDNVWVLSYVVASSVLSSCWF